MLAKHLVGVSASVALVVAACGGSKGTATAGTGASGTSSSTGNGSPASSTSTSVSGSSSGGLGGAGGAAAGSTSSGTAGSTSATTSSGATTTAASTSSASSGSATCAGFNVVGGIFQTTEPWNTAVDTASVDPQSGTIINWLSSAGGWGNGNKMQIDFSINILCADATTPMTPFVLQGGPCGPDCDNVSTFPVPPGGAVEGETGYACNGGGDCHLLVVDKATNKLWEMWEAFSPPDPNVFNNLSGGAFVWDLTKAYPPNLRGDGCTSADAGGFPIAAMLFTADEIAAGHIDHAIRFILPNPRIRDGKSYVHPATHTGVDTTYTAQTCMNNANDCPRPNAPPYGVHLRLKSTFDLTKLPTAGDKVIAKAMQKYGMFLADGGNIALTAANDQFTTAKWADAAVNVSSHDLYPIQVTDFDVVNLGTIVTTGDNCIRNP